MRIYLDTNILAFMLTDRLDDISQDTMLQLNDYTNQLMASSVCVAELIHLCQIGKLSGGRRKGTPHPASIMAWLKAVGISMKSPDEKTLQVFSELILFDDHRDPNDRLIVAQAISDRVPLISSDRKFERYRAYGLDFMFNER
jgi:PIN domain nuclease of toxin-antitoxin system